MSFKGVTIWLMVRIPLAVSLAVRGMFSMSLVTSLVAGPGLVRQVLHGGLGAESGIHRESWPHLFRPLD